MIDAQSIAVRLERAFGSLSAVGSGDGAFDLDRGVTDVEMMMKLFGCFS